MDVIFQGWLTKSPPENKMKGYGPFKSQWRRRYFVLYGPPKSSRNFATDCIAYLHYYENQDKTKKKGSVDLRNCEEVRDRLDSVYYKHLFSIHTSSRTYYLAAESEEEMDNWVDHLIRLLGINNDPNPPSPAPEKFTPSVNGSHSSNVRNLPHPTSHSFGPSDLKSKPQPTASKLDRHFSVPASQRSSVRQACVEHMQPSTNKTLTSVTECDSDIEQDHSDVKSVSRTSKTTDDSDYHVPRSYNSSLYVNDRETNGKTGNVNHNKPSVSSNAEYLDCFDELYYLPPPIVGANAGDTRRPNSDQDIYDVPPPTGNTFFDDGIYDVPPPAPHDRQAASGFHEYVNAPLQKTGQQRTLGVTNHLSLESLSSDDDDKGDYDVPPTVPCVLVSERTRSFRKKI